MKKVTALFSGILLFAAFSAPAFAQAPAAPAAPVAVKPVKEGEVVPNFTIQMLSGQNKTSADLMKNKTVIVTFIQTACSSCKGEIVELNRLAKGAGDKVLVLPVSVDMRSGKEFLENYKSDNAVSFDFGIDPKFAIPRIFGISFTPASIVIKDGKVANIFRGYDDEIKAQLEAVFK